MYWKFEDLGDVHLIFTFTFTQVPSILSVSCTNLRNMTSFLKRLICYLVKKIQQKNSRPNSIVPVMSLIDKLSCEVHESKNRHQKWK